MEKILNKIDQANKSSLMRLLYGFLAVVIGKQPLLRNYRTDIKLDDIIEKILTGKEPKLEISEYTIKLENDDYRFEAWNANKYYAWLSSGIYENKKTGYKYRWGSGMPSRFMAELFLNYTKELAKKSI